MIAMTLLERGSGRLDALERAVPTPHADELLIEVSTCGVCRTDLHVVDGELPQARVPIVPGHEIIGRVVERGSAVTAYAVGDRVGVPWLADACGTCDLCRRGLENLCPNARFTGCHVDGGYAEFTVAKADFCVPLPARYDDVAVAPLLCAGLIGYRAYRAAGSHVARLGLYGFGAAAHIVAQVARHDGREVFAFVSPGDEAAIRFARRVGVAWAGDSRTAPPVPLDAAIIFAPVGPLVPEALSHTVAGGTVVCAGIHMTDIPSFPYRQLWEERTIRSIANLTRADAREFMALAARQPLTLRTEVFDLAAANTALDRLRRGAIEGAAVLRC